MCLAQVIRPEGRESSPGFTLGCFPFRGRLGRYINTQCFAAAANQEFNYRDRSFCYGSRLSKGNFTAGV
jgi:hypothetical protein